MPRFKLYYLSFFLSLYLLTSSLIGFLFQNSLFPELSNTMIIFFIPGLFIIFYVGLYLIPGWTSWSNDFPERTIAHTNFLGFLIPDLVAIILIFLINYLILKVYHLYYRK